MFDEQLMNSYFHFLQLSSRYFDYSTSVNSWQGDEQSRCVSALYGISNSYVLFSDGIGGDIELLILKYTVFE